MTDKTAQSVFSGQDQQHNSEHQTPSIQAPRQAAQTTISSDGKTPESSYQQVDLKTNVTSQDQIKRLRGISPNYNVSLEELQTFLHDLLTSQFQAGRIVQTPFQGSPDGGYNLQLRLKRAASETPQEEQRYLFPTDIAFVLDDIVEFIEVKHASSTAIVLELFRIIVRGETLASLAAETIEGTTYYLESKLTLQANWSKMLRTAEALAVAIDALLTQETGQAERKLLPPLSEFGVPENDVKVLWHHIIQPLAQDFINAVDKNSYVFLSAKSQTISVLSENHYEVISFPPLLNQFSIVAWEFVQQNQSVLKDKWTTVISFFDSHPYTFRQEQELSKIKTPAQSSVGKNFLEVWEFAFHQVAEAEKEDREKRLGVGSNKKRDEKEDFEHVDFSDSYIPVPDQVHASIRNHQAISVHAGFLYNHVLQDLCLLYGLDPSRVQLDPVLEWEIRNQIIKNLYRLTPQELAELRTSGRFNLQVQIFRQLVLQRADFRVRFEQFLLTDLPLNPEEKSILSQTIDDLDQRDSFQFAVRAQSDALYQQAIVAAAPEAITGTQTADDIINQLLALGLDASEIERIRRLLKTVPPSMIYQLRYLSPQDLGGVLSTTFGIDISGLDLPQLAELTSQLAAHNIVTQQTEQTIAQLQAVGISQEILEKSQLFISVEEAEARIVSGEPSVPAAPGEPTAPDAPTPSAPDAPTPSAQTQPAQIPPDQPQAQVGATTEETTGTPTEDTAVPKQLAQKKFFRLNPQVVAQLPTMSNQELAAVLGVDETAVTDQVRTYIITSVTTLSSLTATSLTTDSLITQLDQLGLDSALVESRIRQLDPSLIPHLPHYSAQELSQVLDIEITEKQRGQVSFIARELGTRASISALPPLGNHQQRAEEVISETLKTVDGACKANEQYLETRMVAVQNTVDSFLLRFDDPYAFEDFLDKLTDANLARIFGLQEDLRVEEAIQLRQSAIVYYHLRRSAFVSTLPEHMRGGNISISVTGTPQTQDLSVADYLQQTGLDEESKGIGALTRQYDKTPGSNRVLTAIAAPLHMQTPVADETGPTTAQEQARQEQLDIRTLAFRNFYQQMDAREQLALQHLSAQPETVLVQWRETYIIPQQVVQVIPQVEQPAPLEGVPIGSGPEQFPGSFSEAVQMTSDQQTAMVDQQPSAPGAAGGGVKKSRKHRVRDRVQKLAQRAIEKGAEIAINAVAPGVGTAAVKAWQAFDKGTEKVLGAISPELAEKYKKAKMIAIILIIIALILLILLMILLSLLWLIMIILAVVAIYAALKAFWNWIKEGVKNLWAEVGSFFNDPWNWTNEKIIKPVGGAIESVYHGIGDGLRGIGDGIRSFGKGAQNLWGDIWGTDDGENSGGGSGGGTRGFGGGTLISGGTAAAAATTVLVTSILSTFLNPLPTVDPTSGELSQYVEIKKQAVNQRNVPTTDFDQPEDVTYQVAIIPKPEYQLDVTEATDEYTITFRDEEPDVEPGNPPEPWNSSPNQNLPATENYEGADSFRQALQSIVGGERIVDGIQFPDYTFKFGDDVDGYNHALVRNDVTITFDVYDGEGNLLASGETATTSELICFGNCPVGDYCWPTTGTLKQLPYGGYSHTSSTTGKGADAVDIGADLGTPIYATVQGNACFAEYDPDGYGNHVYLYDLQNERKYVFGHMDSVAVTSACRPGTTQGDFVSAGQVIGTVGSSGFSTGPHLHFEIDYPVEIDYQVELDYQGAFYNVPRSLFQGLSASEYHSDIRDFYNGGNPLTMNQPVRSCYDK